MKCLSIVTSIVAVASVLFAPEAARAQAGAPDSLSFQGYIESSGMPVDEPSATLTFRLYDAPAGGSLRWTETQTGVEVVGGVFSVILGKTSDLSQVGFEAPLWISVAVGNTSAPELTPRTSLTSVPYALSLRNLRVMPTDPTEGPNLIGGSRVNYVSPGVVGATIAGGGDPVDVKPNPNRVTARFGTVGGGADNEAGHDATVAGGYRNRATGVQSAVPGGFSNEATAANSVAAGYNAAAVHAGSFVWSDRSQLALADSFVTTASNQFLVRAYGGVGIGTNSPSSPLTVAGMVESTAGGFKFPDGSTQTTAAAPTTAWNLSGNSGTTPGTHFVGTSDEAALELRVDGKRAMRLEPSPWDKTPNVIGGSPSNAVAADVFGATIGGGGLPLAPNEVQRDNGTIGGGFDNTITADAYAATIGGGIHNTAGGREAAIGGGSYNSALEERATVAGGFENVASGLRSTVAGGSSNTASGSISTVSGGLHNVASGSRSTVAGGIYSRAAGDYSIAAGYYAKSLHEGSFVWNDRSRLNEVDSLYTTAANQFLIRAAGGVGIGTNEPFAGTLHLQNYELDVDDNSRHEDDVLVEANDAVLGLYSSNLGSWGSAIAMGEIVAAGHAFANKWTIARRTSSSGSALHFTFGTDDDYAQNNTVMRIDTDGSVHADGAFAPGGADLAELVNTEGRAETYEPGDVLVVSTQTDRTVERSSAPYSTRIAGVYATRPGVLLRDAGDKENGDQIPMAIVGIVPVKVTLEGGPIRRGDVLVTSSTPGHAMKAEPVLVGGMPILPSGAIIGRAFQPFEGSGTGIIEVLVSVR